MTFRISGTDSTRTARLKLLYLLPIAVLSIPVVALGKAWAYSREVLGGIVESYHHTPHR